MKSESTNQRNLLDGPVPDALKKVALRTWPPGGTLELTPVEKTSRLFIVLAGILTTEYQEKIERVLPREAVCINGDEALVLRNLSRSDELKAIEIEVVQETPPESSQPVFSRYYYSDDSKDNKLCLMAANEATTNVLAINCDLEVFLSALGKWDTILFEQQPKDAAIVLVLRGSATISTQLYSAVSMAFHSNATPTTITGKQPCEILSIRRRMTTT